MAMWMIALAASAQTRSWKRGVAYAMTQDADFEALAPKVSWWYNWHHTASTAAMYKNMEFVPMCSPPTTNAHRQSLWPVSPRLLHNICSAVHEV